MSAFDAAGAGPNPTRPPLLTSKERHAEVCRLLALGLILGLQRWPDREKERRTGATTDRVALAQ